VSRSDRPRDLIRAAIFTLAREAGAEMGTRPAFPDRPDLGEGSPEPEPLAGLAASLALEHAARSARLDFIRAAREAGHGWPVIGAVLGYDAAAAGTGAASWYAADGTGGGQVFAWTCPSCRQTVLDRPYAAGPAEAEQGHGDGCTRLAETVAAYEAQREDGADG
jgi:hypothetical protein